MPNDAPGDDGEERPTVTEALGGLKDAVFGGDDTGRDWVDALGDVESAVAGRVRDAASAAEDWQKRRARKNPRWLNDVLAPTLGTAGLATGVAAAPVAAAGAAGYLGAKYTGVAAVRGTRAARSGVDRVAEAARGSGLPGDGDGIPDVDIREAWRDVSDGARDRMGRTASEAVALGRDAGAWAERWGRTGADLAGRGAAGAVWAGERVAAAPGVAGAGVAAGAALAAEKVTRPVYNAGLAATAAASDRYELHTNDHRPLWKDPSAELAPEGAEPRSFSEARDQLSGLSRVYDDVRDGERPDAKGAAVGAVAVAPLEVARGAAAAPGFGAMAAGQAALNARSRLVSTVHESIDETKRRAAEARDDVAARAAATEVALHPDRHPDTPGGDLRAVADATTDVDVETAVAGTGQSDLDALAVDGGPSDLTPEQRDTLSALEVEVVDGDATAGAADPDAAGEADAETEPAKRIVDVVGGFLGDESDTEVEAQSEPEREAAVE